MPIGGRFGGGLLLATFLCLGASTVQAEAQKIGFVDLDKALRELPEARSGASNLNKLVAQKQKEIDSKRQQVEAAQKALEKDFPQLSNAQRQAREAQLQAMMLDLQNLQQSAQDQVNVQRNQILEKIQQQLVRVVGQIGRQGHYTVILNDKSVLYVNGAIDLTQQVVAAMEHRGTTGAK